MLAFPLVQRSFYDRVLISGETEVLGPVLSAMLGLVVVMMAAKTVATYLFRSVAESVMVTVRSELAEGAYSRPLKPGGRDGTGELVSVATNDVDTMGELYRSVIGNGLVHVLRLGGTLVVLAVFDLRLLLVAFPLLGLYAAVPLGVTRGLRSAGETVQRRTAQLVSTLQEGFSGLRDIKAFGRVSWGVARQREAGNALRDAQLRRTRFELASSGSYIAYWLTIVGISWYGATAVSDGRLTVGTLLAMMLYFGQLQMPVNFLVTLNNRLQQGLAASERVFAQLDQSLPDRVPEGGQPIGGEPSQPVSTLPGSVELEDLSFRYEGGDRDCLDNVSLRAGAREFVAVVGETGSGKTTVLNAMLGFIDPDQGQVRMGGRHLADLPEDELRRLTSVSSSDAMLFDMTIADNIRFGKLDASDDEVRSAAHASAVDEFIESLPEGYETKIGERGERLSTGQRQRVALARALIRRPSILLLDEATSGLDGPTERLVMERLLKQPDRPTIVMVTHRMYALEQADRLYVLDAGRVVEQGDHHTLLHQGGLYYGLCQKQGLAAEPALLLRGGAEPAERLASPPSE